MHYIIGRDKSVSISAHFSNNDQTLGVFVLEICGRLPAQFHDITDVKDQGFLI